MVDYCAYFDNKSRLFEENSEYNRLFLRDNCRWVLKWINHTRQVRPILLFEVLEQLGIPYKYDDVKNLGWKDCPDELMDMTPIENSNAFLVTFHCQEL